MPVAVETARLALERLLYLQRLRDVALAAFRAGKLTDRLRASIVAERVARALDVENSNWFRRDLTMALRAAGWRSVKRGNVRMWKGKRPR